MRKLFVGAIVGVLALAVAAIAVAATNQTYKQSFSSPKANKSVGTKFSTDSTDPSNTANNNQPKAVRTFNIKFPAGTAVDSKATVECKANDDQVFNAPPGSDHPVCPKSVVGAGSARVRLPFHGNADINATVTALDAPKSLILYVNPQGSNPIILRPKFKGNLKNGPTLSTPVPPTCILSSAQNGHCVQSNGQPGQQAILTHFDLKTVSKKKGKHVLIRSPKKCKGTWTFKATLKYEDGTSKHINSKQACKK